MNQKKTIRSLPASERPYEKCLAQGPGILTDAELLAVILRTGSREKNSLELASAVLARCPYAQGLTGILHLNLESLRSLKGIGSVKAVQILCIGELSRRISRENARNSLCFSDPGTIAEYYMESLRHEEQEHLIGMMLDAGNHFLADVHLTSGTVNASLVSPREIFLAALEHHAVSLVLVHNHPSGNCTPSPNDIRATKRVAEAGELLGIRLLDHIIIGDRCYASLVQSGQLNGHG